MMLCRNCGTELPDDSTFCHNCGEKVDDFKETAVESNDIKEVNVKKNPKRKLVILSALLCLFVIIGGIGVLVYKNNDKSQDLLETAKNKLLASNYLGAIDDFDKVIADDSSCADAYIGKANAYIGLDNISEAEKIINEVTNMSGLQPDDSEKLNQMANRIQILNNKMAEEADEDLDISDEEIESDENIRKDLLIKFDEALSNGQIDEVAELINPAIKDEYLLGVMLSDDKEQIADELQPYIDEVQNNRDNIGVKTENGKTYIDISKYLNLYDNDHDEYLVNESLDTHDFSGTLYPVNIDGDFYILSEVADPLIYSTSIDKAKVSNKDQKLIALHHENKGWGFMDRTGRLLTYFSFEYVINEPYGGFYPVQLSTSKWTFINPVTGEYSETRFDNVYEEYASYSGYYKVKLDGKSYLYNPVKDKLIGGSYQLMGCMSAGVVPVCNGSKYGFMDESENLVVDYIFDYIEPCSTHDFFCAEYESRDVVINSKGEAITPYYDDCRKLTIYESGLIVFLGFAYNYDIYDSNGNLLYENASDIVPLNDNRFFIWVDTENLEQDYAFLDDHSSGKKLHIIDGNGIIIRDLSKDVDDSIKSWGTENPTTDRYGVDYDIEPDAGCIVLHTPNWPAYVDVVDYDGNSIIGGDLQFSDYNHHCISENNKYIMFFVRHEGIIYELGNGKYDTIIDDRIRCFNVKNDIIVVSNVWDNDRIYGEAEDEEIFSLGLQDEKICIPIKDRDDFKYAVCADGKIISDGYVYDDYRKYDYGIITKYEMRHDDGDYDYFYEFTGTAENAPTIITLEDLQSVLHGLKDTLKSEDDADFNALVSEPHIYVDGTNIDNSDYSLKHLYEYIDGLDSTTYSPQLAYALMGLCWSAHNRADITKSVCSMLSITKDDFISGNYRRDKFDTVGYSIGRKEMPDGDDVIVITLRGTDNDLDNISNFNLGGGLLGFSWHQGFSAAAHEVYDELSRFDGGIHTSGTKYIVTGHSRGAAVANLIEVMLSDDGVPKTNVYGYNFACPDVAVGNALGVDWNPAGAHDNMFNIANAKDPISVLPGIALKPIIAGNLGSWGKFGRSYWYCDDWSNSSNLGYDFNFTSGTHIPSTYVNTLYEYAKQNIGISSFKDWFGLMNSQLAGALKEAGADIVCACVMCPVDVDVLSRDGDVLLSITDNKVEYKLATAEDCLAFVYDNDKKLIILNALQDCYLRLHATDEGSMTYMIGKVNLYDDEISDVCEYNNIQLAEDKVMISEISTPENISDSKIFIINNDGDYISEINAEGQEIRLSNRPASRIILILCGCFAAVVILGGILILRKSHASKGKVQE